MKQLERLRTLLRLLAPANRFYAERLRAARVDENVESFAHFVARMPFTRKDELIADQQAHPPYGSNLTFPLRRYSRFCQTSGTSGQPLVWLDTQESWRWMLKNWEEIYRAADVGIGERIYFAFSFGPFLGFWTAFEAAAGLGLLCLPGGGLGSAARLRALIHHRATVLCCTPTYALHLAEVAEREGIDLHDAAVRKIIVAGEPGGSIIEVRARISKAWNDAAVIDHYGMTEVGPVAFEEEPGILRIIERSYFAEIIDPTTGVAVDEGEMGELVLTTLGRVACPLLRYRTGDLVRRATDRESFALKDGILGRADDMVMVRGVNIYPGAIDALVRSVAGLDEYRVELSRRGALPELTLQVESDDDAVARKLESALHHAFSLRIPVRNVARGTLPRFEMKARRWVRSD